MYDKLKDKLSPIAATRWGWSGFCLGAILSFISFQMGGTAGIIIGAILAAAALFSISLWFVLGKCPQCGTPVRTRDMYCSKCRTVLFVLPKDLPAYKAELAAKAAEIAEEKARMKTAEAREDTEAKD